MYAEELNYWKTGSSAPDSWVEKAQGEIRNAGGVLIGNAFGSEAQTGRAAYMIEFSFGQDRYKLVWPVLPCRVKSAANERAARVQAATMLYHDVKARCVTAKVQGARSAFFSYLLLPDGRTAAQAASHDLARLFPRMLVTTGERQSD